MGQQASKQQNVAVMDRYLSQTDVWAIAFGCIIGWGAFMMPGSTFLPIAGPAGTLIAMAISAVIMLIVGSNYAFLMVRRPGTGGVYAYTKEAFGRDHAFLCSWFLCLSYLSIVFLNATALFVVSRTLFGSRLQFGFHYQIAGYDVYLCEVALSVAALALIGLLFILGKPLLQRIQTVLAVILLAGALTITIVCVPHFGEIPSLNSFGLNDNSGASVVLTIVLLSPWAFVGFDVISLETAHFKFPVKRSRRIIALSILCGGFVYAAMSLVSITSVPDGFASWQQYIAGLDELSGVATVPTFYAAQSIMGSIGLVIMGVTALAAILTGIIGAYRASLRVLSTMAQDHILSERFAATTFCILFIMLISSVISFLGRNALEWFVELTTFGAIVGFGYTSAAAYRIAKKEKNTRIARTGIIGTVITGAFAFVQLIPKVTQLETMGAPSFLMLALWCLLGFVFYWRTMSRSGLQDYNGATTSSTVLFSLLLYSLLMWFSLTLRNAKGSEALQPVLVRSEFLLIGLILVGLIVMLTIQNLLRRRHEAVEREKIHAEESSRAKSQFLFNMSHDIRTPMNAIMGFTVLAKRKGTTEKEKDEYLSKIESSGHHLLGIINDVLDMSRIESGKMELYPVIMDLETTLAEMRDLFADQMERKHLHFSVDASGLQDKLVLCDKNRFNRVLLNLVSNAYKFTQPGGTVEVTLVQTGAEDGNGHYELKVRDTGIGMSEDFVENIFTPFERERSSTVSGIQGTGLGMSITKGIVDMMHGSIDIRTKPNEGSTFTVELELPIAAGETAPEEKAEAAAIDFSQVHVLLVEDNEINKEIAKMILGKAGFQVATAEDGRVAVDAVSMSRPGDYDLILMDIQMPVMDGYTATRAIRALDNKQLASIPIIAMTANAFKEDERAAAEAGMQGHIAKPIDVEKMLQTITEVLQAKDAEKA